MPEAFLLLRLEGPPRLKDLLAVEGVAEAYAVKGEFNAVARLRAECLDGLMGAVERIKGLRFVRSAVTLIIYK